MTVKDLLAYFENYYGEKYTDVLLDVTTDYLDGASESFCNAAAKVLAKRFSRIYNKVPGPAEFEKYINEIYAAMPKPKELPRPEMQKATPEEAEMYIKQMRAFIKPGSMAKPLNNFINSFVDFN